MGVKLIDDQHKGLLSFVNDLFNHDPGDEAAEKVYFQKVARQAIEYVRVHFATEEKFMEVTKFPGYAEHKKEHDEFVLTVAKSIKDYNAGKRMLLKKFASFLRDWILSHVAITDKKYSEYFWKVATRKADGRLSITAEDIK